MRSLRVLLEVRIEDLSGFDLIARDVSTVRGGSADTFSRGCAPPRVLPELLEVRRDGTHGCGLPCHLLMDMGAEQTFTRSDYVDATGLQIAGQQLHGVTGHCLSLKRQMQASIGIGNTEKLPMFVVDIEEPCLFGIDHLTQCEASLDLGRQTMRVQAEEMPLFPSSDNRQGFCVESRRVTAPDVKVKLHQSTGGRSESYAALVVPGKARPAEGLYIIDEALIDVTYRITPESGEKRKVMHVDRLARYVGPSSLSWDESPEGEEWEGCGGQDDLGKEANTLSQVSLGEGDAGGEGATIQPLGSSDGEQREPDVRRPRRKCRPPD
ncbi:hypothetical protein E2C01_033972 [Portunus trituberculatus]|uniref:Peptidase A2 domain-containing protein n=1 Tax=Portunus trituberculatus TaxID=210409 RepID=A0A5B7F475_PORTR|nr:hypothetical protein [Portunus trituberculatus]